MTNFRWSRMLLVLACSLALGLIGAEETTDTAPPAVPGGGNVEPKWPRVFQKDGNVVELYPPQIDEWKDHQKIAFRMAMALTPKGAQEPSYGVIQVKAKTELINDSRMVLMTDLDKSARFNGVKGDQEDQLKKLCKDLLPKSDFLEVSLDRIIAYLDVSKDNVKSVDVNMDPPTIFRSESPAILAVFMGPPQLKPVPNTRVMFAVNANWPVLFDQDSSKYFLLNEDSWLTAADPVKGPWAPAQALPAEFSKLPDNEEWADVRKNIPAKPAKDAVKVFASSTPAELIVTDGSPSYTPVAGTKLMYVSNPAMPLFLNTEDNCHYFLVAGRWFRSKGLDGPWTAASADLPPQFGSIPEDSPVGYVLASVPGTAQAKDAVLLASVPQKATIKRSEAKLEVAYQGEPKFAPIEGTKMTYAVNTPHQVICVKDKYYCCYNGVWFVAPAATGPWAVCDNVPSAIYTIPSTSPVYNVTYVNVYDSTEDAVVVGHTGGYSGEYVAATGVLMFGAGVIAGAIWADNHDHWYYPSAYYSYGFGATYHYGYGGYYGCGARYYGPYGGAGYSARYNPATGVYSRSAYAYGPGGARYATQAYNPYTGRYGQHTGGTNGYASWGQTAVAGPNGWAAGGHVSTAAGGRAGYVENSQGQWARGGQTAAGGGAFQTGSGAEGFKTAGGGGAVKTSGGDVYAGKDGNVYKKTDDGWQKYNNGSWNLVNKPTTATNTTAAQTRPGSTAGTGESSPRTPYSSQRSGGSENVQSGLDRESSTRARTEQSTQRFQSSAGSAGASSQWQNRGGSFSSGASSGSTRSWSGGSGGGVRSGGGGGGGRR